MIKFFLSLFCIVSFANLKTNSIKHVLSELEKLKSGTYVVLELDGVVFKAKDPILRRGNLQAFNKEKKDLFDKVLLDKKGDVLKAKKHSSKLIKKIKENQDFSLVNSEVSQVLKICKRRNLKLFLVSFEKDYPIQKNLIRNLEKNAFICSDFWPYESEQFFKLERTLAVFNSGILFLPKSNLPVHLVDFFNQQESDSKKAVFVVLNKKPFSSLSVLLIKEKISYDIIEYTYLNDDYEPVSNNCLAKFQNLYKTKTWKEGIL